MDFLSAVSAGPVADSTITVAHDCGSGDDRWLFVAVPLFSAGETPTVASVAYDGAALAAGAPTLSNPAIGQAHALAADGLVAGAPTLGEPLFVFAVGKVTVSVTGGKPGMTVTAGGPSLSVVAASPHMDIGD